MYVIRSMITAFALFSRIPMPRIEWKDENMRYVLAALPLVGVVIGAVVWLWVWLCSLLSFGTILFAGGLTLIPWAVSGGIHLDGFADTCDALGSNASPERKREILKDSRVGVFGALGLMVYLLAYFAVCSELSPSFETALLLGLAYITSRTIGGLASLVLPSSNNNGLTDVFRRAGGKTSIVLLIVFFIASSVALSMFFGVGGGASLVVSLACFVYLKFMSKRQFGGMSGDLAGYGIQLCELLMIASIIVAQKVVVI